MKVLVTGATGVLGSNLVRVLISRGYQVKTFIQADTNTSTIDQLPVEKAEGNILNFGEVLSAAEGVDAICHLAADTSVWPSRNPSAVRVNVDGTKNAVKAAMLVKVRRFVHVGTANSFSYGSAKCPGAEDTPYRCHKYGLDYMDSKYRAQQVVKQAAANGLPAVIVNPTFMLGAYDSKPSSGQMLLALYKGHVKGYTSGGKNFICVEDAAVGVANALMKGRLGESYILGHENLSYKEAFTRMAKVMKIKPPKARIPGWLVICVGLLNSAIARLTGRKPGVSLPLARIACEGHYYSSAKAVKELDLPQTPIEEGIRQSFQWMKDRHYVQPEPGFFSGKVAIVTGSSQGIGKAIASELLKRGAKVVINGRDEAKLLKAKADLRIFGKLTAIKADVSDPEEAAMLVAETSRRYGRIDILINNAGLSMKGRLAELRPEIYKKVFDANVMGSVYPCTQALKHLRESLGSIVFISSIAGIRGLPNHSAYCSSKMALRGIAESLRIEEANSKVHIGLVQVGFTQNDPKKKTLNAAGELVPVEDRAGFKPKQPEIVARAVLKNIENRKFVTTLSLLGRLNKSINNLSPALSEFLVKNLTRKRHEQSLDKVLEASHRQTTPEPRVKRQALGISRFTFFMLIIILALATSSLLRAQQLLEPPLTQITTHKAAPVSLLAYSINPLFTDSSFWFYKTKMKPLIPI